MTDRSVSVTIDFPADAAYVKITDGPVVKTVEPLEGVNVDLDEHDMVVGIEIIELEREWPMAEVVARYHVPSQVADIVARISSPVIKQPGDPTFAGSTPQRLNEDLTAATIGSRHVSLL